MLKQARPSSVSKVFLSRTSFSQRVDSLERILFFKDLILRPSCVIYFWISRTDPLLLSIILAILFSGFLWMSTSSGLVTKRIFLSAYLYYSFTGKSRRMKTGDSSRLDRSNVAPVGCTTIAVHFFIVSWNHLLRSVEVRGCSPKSLNSWLT